MYCLTVVSAQWCQPALWHLNPLTICCPLVGFLQCSMGYHPHPLGITCNGIARCEHLGLETKEMGRGYSERSSVYML